MESFSTTVIDEKPLTIVQQISIFHIGYTYVLHLCTMYYASHFRPVALAISTIFCFVEIWSLYTFKFQHGREINKHYEFEVE